MLPGRPADEDSRLLLEARTDGSAFAEFYRRTKDHLLGWLYQQTLDPEVAADLAAETYAAALVKLRRFDPERGPARAWLWGFATVELRRWRRKGEVADRARRRVGIEPIAVDDEAMAHVESLVDLAGLVDAATEQIASLPPSERDAVQLRVLHGLGYDEIADQLCCSPTAGRVRVSRGLARLRVSLVAYDPGPTWSGSE